MPRSKEGRLFYNSQFDRIDIQFDDHSTYGGLHCGDCFEIREGYKWSPVRIELGSDWWYLEDENEHKLDINFGSEVRI